ncbi:MAG: transketolase, partial [Planctomycetota bacterium]
MPENADIATLEKMAQKLRRHSIETTTNAKSGHPTTCMSAAEIFAALFFREMRFDPKNPAARNVDLFVLSKGHAAPILWAALKEAGAIDEDLMSLRKFDSTLEGHPTPRNPWVRVATGSLGQGLSAAAGMAQARKIDGTPGRIYCLLGDGETAEGAIWEAAAFAAHYRLDNLCAIVDINRLAQSGPTMYEHDVDSFVRRFDAFGWHAIQIDGHSMKDLLAAFDRARKTTGRPTVLLAKTLKGKGFSLVEDRDNWHGKPIPKDKLADAIKELGDTNVTIPVEARTYKAPAEAPLPRFKIRTGYKPGDTIATRMAFGLGLAKLGAQSPAVVSTDGDTKNSTYSDRFKEAFPERFIDAYIAEQNMVGAALGMATEGKVAFASSFAAFLTRAYDFIRMAGFSQPKHLILCGSHAGVSIGEDGPSQMALEDLAMMRPIFNCTVLYPSDGVSSEKIVATAANTPGIVYIRTTRPKLGILYNDSEDFPVGG